MKDYFEVVVKVLLAYGLPFLLIILITRWVDYSQCGSKTRKMGFNSDWGIIQGCMVEYKPGKWIDIDRYRAVDE